MAACKIGGVNSVAEGYKYLQQHYWEKSVKSAKAHAELMRYKRDTGTHSPFAKWTMEGYKKLGIWRGANQQDCSKEEELLKFAALGDQLENDDDDPVAKEEWISPNEEAELMGKKLGFYVYIPLIIIVV